MTTDTEQTAVVLLQYASMATQIGTAARAEAPLRALKAISPNITKKRVPKPAPATRYSMLQSSFATTHFLLMF